MRPFLFRIGLNNNIFSKLFCELKKSLYICTNKMKQQLKTNIMKTYNFKKFTNGKGEEMLTVLTPGIMTENMEELMNIPTEERVKKLFTLEIVELTEYDKEEIIEDYIYFEGGIKDKEEQENLYNQMMNFK